jgi:glycerol-3-phosphate acyltransferase PlsY
VLNITLLQILLLGACYLVGSIPFGYLIVQFFHSKDISKEGSGNVGTLNAYQVSKSKLVAIAVLMFDFLKGSVPVYILIYVLKLDPLNVLVLSSFLVVGHNYPVWLKFRGGRGLASGAGIFLIINYLILISWCVAWILFFSFKRDVLFSNSLATFLMPVFALLFKELYHPFLPVSMANMNYLYFVFFTALLTIFILIRHKPVFSKLIHQVAGNSNK